MATQPPIGDSAVHKRTRIRALDLGDGDPLANAPADPSLLFSLEELGISRQWRDAHAG